MGIGKNVAGMDICISIKGISLLKQRNKELFNNNAKYLSIHRKELNLNERLKLDAKKMQ